ncbi:PH domain-containing protein [Psychroflexus salinarum]|uniref:PH domain-containing protein n=1 Tax=Psychroflexus salinarum TaxID=546024 RepID=A0ABW3GKI0_9FLAO
MKFKNKTDMYYTTIAFGMVVILAVFIAIIIHQSKESDSGMSIYLPVINFIAISLLILQNYFKLSYDIKNSLLICHSNFVNEIIPISRIHSVTYENKYIFGLHPATAKSGLLLTYKTNEEIFVTPKDENLFIEKLLEFNSDIQVKENHKLLT